MRAKTGTINATLTLGAAAKLAKAALGESLVAWWCDPTIDLAVVKLPSQEA